MSLRNTRWSIAALLCLALWTGTALGQTPALFEAYDRYAELRDQGRYREALPFAKQALNLGKEEFGPDHPNTATFLNNLALLYFDLARYAEAETLHKRSLEIREKTRGPEHPRVATSLNNLALLYEAQPLLRGRASLPAIFDDL